MSHYRSQFDTDLYPFGNKLGRLLANLARGRRTVTHITALKDKRGNTCTDPKHINQILQEFYRTLYLDHSDPLATDHGKHFLESVNLPLVQAEHRELLNKEITESEILTTIKGLSPRPRRIF